MLNEVKKNPRVSAKDLQKSWAHANISVDESTIRIRMVFMGGHHGRSHCCPKKTLLHVWSSQKSTWMFHSAKNIMLTDETKVVLFGRKTQHYVWRKKRHNTPTSKPYPNCKLWWREHHGLGLLCCLSLLSLTEKWIPKFIKTENVRQENVRLSVCQLKLNRR